MHDSLNPIAGITPLTGMWLNCIWGGVGVGLINLLIYLIVGVFIAGLMVGRTPEYLGKKVEAKEMKLASLAMLAHPILILIPAGLFVATDWGFGTRNNPARTAFRKSSTNSLLPRPTTARASKDWATPSALPPTMPRPKPRRPCLGILLAAWSCCSAGSFRSLHRLRSPAVWP